MLALLMYLKHAKFWQHQLVKFDFAADLSGTGNRSEEVIKWYCLFTIVYNDDADLEVSDTCIRNSLLSWELSWVTNTLNYSASSELLWLSVTTDVSLIGSFPDKEPSNGCVFVHLKHFTWKFRLLPLLHHISCFVKFAWYLVWTLTYKVWALGSNL